MDIEQRIDQLIAEVAQLERRAVLERAQTQSTRGDYGPLIRNIDAALQALRRASFDIHAIRRDEGDHIARHLANPFRRP